MTPRSCLALAAAGLALAACDSDPVGLDVTSATAPAVALSAATDYADEAPTFDAVLNEVSLRHPGFKGVVGSDDGSRTLVLTGVSAALGAPSLLADLAATLGGDPAGLVLSALPVADVRPDFHELYVMKTGLRRFLFEGDLVTFLDLDEVNGRILVGTASAADEDEVRTLMTPEEVALTRFVTRPPAVSYVGDAGIGAASLANRSLRNDPFRPLIAGPETKFLNPRLNQQSFCTVGPAVRYNGGSYGFLTAAHCTFDRTQLDGTQFFQPSRQPSDRVGTESAEPTYRSGVFITDGYYSDVVFVRTQNGIGLRGQMTSSDNCLSGGGLCTENGIVNDVLGTSSYLPVGVRVFKTGRSTGSTAGKITGTCVDIFGGDGRKNLCQSVVQYDPNIPSSLPIAGGGDSGSAVLTNGGTPGTNAGTLAGVLWGGPGDAETFYFSPWENIWQQERAGTAYGLPLNVVTASQGTVVNQTGGGGGPSDPGCPGPASSPDSDPGRITSSEPCPQ